MTTRQASSDQPYRGADRRQHSLPAPVVQLPVLPGLAVLLLLAVLTASLTSRGPVRAEAVDAGLRLLSATLLTGSGLLCLVRWRMTGLTRPAFIGAGLLTLGVFGQSLRTLAPLVHGRAEQALPGQLTAAATTLAALWLFVWARRAPAIDASARPHRVLGGVSLAVPLACAAVAAWSAPLSSGTDALPVALPWLVLAALWAAVATAERRAGLDARSPWLVIVFGCLAAAAAFDGLAGFAPQPAAGWAALLTMAAAAVALHGTFSDVLTSLSAQSSRLLRMSVDVYDHEQQQRSVRAQEEERLHEVRNVLAGLHAATATLRKYEDRLDPGVRHRLEDAVTGELGRLSHLLDPQLVVPVTDVDVEAELAPVVVAELEQGANVTVDLQQVRVRGRAGDVSTVVSALLVNARRHAPGSDVTLRAEVSDGEARIYVEDRGPGVALDQRQLVFERGERAGATTAGNGLGLYTARRLATEMGGTLQVDSRPGGGASFVLTLSAVSVADPREDVPERGAQGREVTHLQVVRRLERRSVPRQREHGVRADLELSPGRDDCDSALLTHGVRRGDPVEIEGPAHGVAQQPG